MKHCIALVTLCGLLTGCQTTSSPPVTTVAVCSIIQTWSKEDQARLRAEIIRGVGPLTSRMSAEWVSLRDQARTCLARNRRPAGPTVTNHETGGSVVVKRTR